MTETSVLDLENPIIIRASGRGSFQNCRRRWKFLSSSHPGQYRRLKENPVYFWQGTGFHYAMEDYYGWNKYGSPAKAFQAYTEGCLLCPSYEMPDNWEVYAEQTIQMCNYYTDYWVKSRDELETAWIDGEPQVEVKWRIAIMTPRGILLNWEGRPVVAEGTIDRVVVDQNGLWWLLDYKTAANFSDVYLETDLQISQYCWAGSAIYDQPIHGLIYQQHRKKSPEGPKWLSSGKYSSAQNQVTSYPLYFEAMMSLYGDPAKFPRENRRYMDHLAEQEDEHKDKYVRRTFAKRTLHQQEAEGVKILMEAEEMIREDLALYPRPNQYCGSCDVKDACLGMDRGEDWEEILEELTEPITPEDTSWRQHLP